jgi:hypothetical protein
MFAKIRVLSSMWFEGGDGTRRYVRDFDVTVQVITSQILSEYDCINR